MKKALFSILLMSAIFSLNAKSFSLQVIQKNTPGDNVFDTSYVVEQSILDYFFERGMIVSNSAVIVSNKGERLENSQVLSSVREAKEGYMDFFIKLYLNFTLPDSPNPSAVLLSNIKDAKIEILSTKTSETLAKGTYVPKAITSSNNNRGGVESFATDIAMDIQAKLAKKGGAK